ncbi:hypothetical protein HYALB_00009050 [Hymenoscyphus albidus]|uniref:Spermine/spermidine synthase n=1 Tax=Hymenoscyphus albidus TaxID=595503 RepID=A0A9N9LK00_9HELO|nr:hypothetical protein HYALB_00009050 [Hymenoscyphus albidus]
MARQASKSKGAAKTTSSEPNPKSEPSTMDRTVRMEDALEDAPLLTQENFEKELKALASKAQQETWGKWAREQASVLSQAATLLSLAAVYSNVSYLSLSPIYGSIPSGLYHAKGVMSACFLGWSLNLWFRRLLPVKPVYLLPVLAAWIPVSQFFLFQVSGAMGARWGPVVIQALGYLPLLMMSVSCTATVLDDLDMNPGRWQWLAEATPGIASYAFFKTVEYFSGNWINANIGATIVQTRIGLSLLLTALYSLFAPSKLLLYAAPAVLHTLFLNKHFQTPYGLERANGGLQKTGWALVDRKESITGYISIVESAGQFRAMRCDHSLLGGEWFARSDGIKEPIYGVFVMLEAVRLVKVEMTAPEREKTALVIGLGIGTTPAAFMAHGIDTTIVEIDPVVHEYATKYFALPEEHTAVINDAVKFASNTAKAGKKYDYIVHDVFTGGAEPVNLFTLEFIQDLYDMLEPWGVIAINYAADLTLPPSLITTTTIQQVFPTCRIFRESAAPSQDEVAEHRGDFTNMVIFCTKEAHFPSSSSEPKTIEFNNPKAKDYLGSRARKEFLVPRFEVLPQHFAPREEGEMEVLRKNETERFEGWQQTSAMGHWTVMRRVLPQEVWEGW